MPRPSKLGEGLERHEVLDPDDPEAVGLVERSLATSPLWQMGPRAPASRVDRRDPRLLEFLASARNAPLGELEFDVLAWMITRWYQVGRPRDGKLDATLGDLARSMYGAKGGGKQYALIRNALDNLYAVSIDFVLIENDDEGVVKATRRKRIIQALEIKEPIGPGALNGAGAGGGVEVELASWLVSQLDSQTVTALSWGLIRRLTGVSKRLAVYLAAHSRDFSPITRHTERFVVELEDDLYDELGITATRERQRRASVARALARIAKYDTRYSMLCVEQIDGIHTLRAERPIGADVVQLIARAD